MKTSNEVKISEVKTMTKHMERKANWRSPVGFLVLLLLSGVSISAWTINKNFNQDETTPITENIPKPVETPSKNPRYSQMSDNEKRHFIASKSEELLNSFGRVNSDKISDAGLESIKKFVDGYVRRIKKPRKNNCSVNGWLNSDLESILERGKQKAPMIKKAFKDKNLDPQIGIYVAMIESEFCPCLQSPTGALGMFQFTFAMGQQYGINTKKGSTPVNPDDRCSPADASKAAASYIDYVIGYTEDKFGKDYGKNALGIPLAISAFNSGEGSLNKNIKTVKELNNEKPVSFWSLMDNNEKLTNQFQLENIKYIPKFFAAVIIGENPETFGISGIEPLSKSN